MSEEFAPDPSGKVQLRRGGDLLMPARCIMCGVAAYDVDKKFLDIQVDVEDYGVVYFCVDCGEEIGRAVGCAPAKIHAKVVDANKVLEKENKNYESMLDRLGDGLERDILDYLSKRGISVPGIPIPDSDSEDASGQASGDNDAGLSESGGSDSDTTNVDTESTDDEPESDEPTVIEGPADVSEPTSNDTTNDARPATLEL